MDEDYRNTPEGRKAARIYADIIHMQRPEPIQPRMDRTHRAKIFSPYDALRGFDEEIEAADEKIGMIPRIELSEERQADISERLSHIRKGMPVSITFFVESPTEGMGNYVTEKGEAVGTDPVSHVLKLRRSSPEKKNPSDNAGKIEKDIPFIIHFEDIINITYK